MKESKEGLPQALTGGTRKSNSLASRSEKNSAVASQQVVRDCDQSTADIRINPSRKDRLLQETRALDEQLNLGLHRRMQLIKGEVNNTHINDARLDDQVSHGVQKKMRRSYFRKEHSRIQDSLGLLDVQIDHNNCTIYSLNSQLQTLLRRMGPPQSKESIPRQIQETKEQIRVFKRRITKLRLRSKAIGEDIQGNDHCIGELAQLKDDILQLQRKKMRLQEQCQNAEEQLRNGQTRMELIQNDAAEALQFLQNREEVERMHAEQGLKSHQLSAKRSQLEVLQRNLHSINQLKQQQYHYALKALETHFGNKEQSLKKELQQLNFKLESSRDTIAVFEEQLRNIISTETKPVLMQDSSARKFHQIEDIHRSNFQQISELQQPLPIARLSPILGCTESGHSDQDDIEQASPPVTQVEKQGFVGVIVKVDNGGDRNRLNTQQTFNQQQNQTQFKGKEQCKAEEQQIRQYKGGVQKKVIGLISSQPQLIDSNENKTQIQPQQLKSMEFHIEHQKVSQDKKAEIEMQLQSKGQSSLDKSFHIKLSDKQKLQLKHNFVSQSQFKNDDQQQDVPINNFQPQPQHLTFQYSFKPQRQLALTYEGEKKQ